MDLNIKNSVNLNSKRNTNNNNPVVFIKPSTKLENLENTLLKTNNSKTQLPKTLQSSSLINQNEQGKVHVLQRSISEKLRNSFKNRKQLSINTVKIEPRKWHSERYKKNSINQQKSLFLNTKLKSINTSNRQLPSYRFNDKFSDSESSDSESSDEELNLKNFKTLIKPRGPYIDSDTDSDSNIYIRKNILNKIKDIDDSNSSESESDLDDLTSIFNITKLPKLSSNNNTNQDDDEVEFLEEINEENEYSKNGHFYERVHHARTECEICYDFCFVNTRNCCNLKSCNKCINLYIQSQIKESCGNVRIECLNNNCKKLIHKDEICERMNKFDKETLNLYLKFLVDANKDSKCKTCPRCSHIMNLDNLERRVKSSKTTLLTKCQCTECQLVWCFQCHAPWHDGIACNEFRKGDRMLKYWAKEVHYGQQNAQICPKCNIYIQRTQGCDHMSCPFCNNDFCYKCGKKFRSLKFIGDHYSKLSILGCKYKLYPDKPFKRKLIRSSVLGGKIVAAPFVAAVGLVVGVGVLAVGCVALPVYGTYRIAKRIKLKKGLKKIEEDESTGVDYIYAKSDENNNNESNENKNGKEYEFSKEA
ncbi:unnamed protein product [Brachionus calyciflorus]|uniref:RBR-type E3 ubiquitin transferase n=1 Tax=Brachionus calyciflorus TaxID=104777 RepID=A0A813NBR1_9BILA|nr:unnamed protein product [Brachionus calyciflorus]